MPKVSIVLPTYNGEKYIRESIESIINQTFSDWELIIVNDCSTDETPVIINKYAENDSRIRIINNEKNQKLPKSLNIGFSHATGKYYTWTSDDNIYLPEALEVMNQYLDKETSCPMVCTAMNLIDYEDKIVGSSAEYTYEKMLLNNCVGASFMYRNNVRNDIGEYDEGRFLVEDYDYWLRIIFHYGWIDYLDEKLYLYRVHEDSLSEKKRTDVHEQLLKLREKYIKRIVAGLKDRKDLLYQVYYELRAGNYCKDEVKQVFEEADPELGLEKEVFPEENLIIYGAGNYGRAALQKFEHRVSYFADQNINLVGKKINGIEVVSIEKLEQYKKKFDVIIAVSPANLYSCIETLRVHEIEKYYIYLNENIVLYKENNIENS